MSAPITATSPPSTDAELVRAYRGGDERAATALVERHASSVARFLGAIGTDAQDLDDLLQETFIRAFRALDGWRKESAFRNWLLSIAANLRRDEYRRRKGKATVPLDDCNLASAEDPASRFEAHEAERRLQQGLLTLPRLQREVFLLRAQQALSYEEIAVTLETTPGSARVHYHHAVKRLKELMQ